MFQLWERPIEKKGPRLIRSASATGCVLGTVGIYPIHEKRS